MKYKSLKGKKKFAELFDKGTFYGGPEISLRFLSLETRDTALPEKEIEWAFCVSSKLGKAVVRNRYRRICRESLRALNPRVEAKAYIALFPKKKFAALNFKERTDSLASLLNKAAPLLKHA